MKIVIAALIALPMFASSAFAGETVLKRCEGWQPAYFAELVKIENSGRVIYQVNVQGNVKNYSSLSEAQTQFAKDCVMVKSWE
jgi:hypothetical protein